MEGDGGVVGVVGRSSKKSILSSSLLFFFGGGGSRNTRSHRIEMKVWLGRLQGNRRGKGTQRERRLQCFKGGSRFSHPVLGLNAIVMRARVGVYCMHTCIDINMDNPNTCMSIHKHPCTLLQGACHFPLCYQVKKACFIPTLGKLLTSLPIYRQFLS